MKVLIFALVSLFGSSACFAAKLPCGPPGKVDGIYQTVVKPGYAPNALKLTSRDGEWHLDLSTIWAPNPNDNGEHGTVGHFEGTAKPITPWRCVALFEFTDKSEEDSSVVTCILVLVFDGRRKIRVESKGQCEYFHGHRAYPSGTYIRSGGA
jgi:hypothetical protein